MKKIYFFICSAFLLLATVVYAAACGIEPVNEETYYSVSFLVEPPVNITVKSGEKIQSGDVPSAEKDGYVFIGWYNGDTLFDISSDIVSDLTLSPEYQKREITLSAYNGSSMSVLPKAIKDYLACEPESEIAEYLYKYEQNYETASSASGVNFRWSANFTDNFTVYIASDREFTENLYSFDTKNTSLIVYNLIPNTYFWKVVSENGAESETDSFVISEKLRAINCGNILNMRDEGGKIGQFGEINYGMAYRSAQLSKADGVVADDKAIDVLVNNLKIKSEIDLRLSVSERASESPDESIALYYCGILQWDYIFPNFNPNRPYNKIYTDNLKKGLLLFADEKNYPIVFHCSAGADRTGTFAFILGGMLGLSYDDLVKDFEMTSFYMRKRWRSDIEVVGNEYSFTENGIMRDDAGNLIDFNKCYNHVMERYGTGDGKLSSAIENYLYTVVGLTKTDVESIRGLLIKSYESKFHTVTFTDGENILATCRIYQGETVSELAVGGYTYQWSLNNVPYVFSTPITKDITLVGTNKTLKSIGIKNILKDITTVAAGGDEPSAISATLQTASTFNRCSVGEQEGPTGDKRTAIMYARYIYKGSSNYNGIFNWGFDITAADIDAWSMAGYTKLKFSVYKNSYNTTATAGTQAFIAGDKNITLNNNCWNEIELTLEEISEILNGGEFDFSIYCGNGHHINDNAVFAAGVTKPVLE